jgi:hypothetical protein
LVEGSMKLLLCVFYSHYQADEDARRDKKTGRLIDPDALKFEDLRQFFAKRIWSDEPSWNTWIDKIQQRRNAIHAFRSRSIGTWDEFWKDVATYRDLLRYIDSHLPSPD